MKPQKTSNNFLVFLVVVLSLVLYFLNVSISGAYAGEIGALLFEIMLGGVIGYYATSYKPKETSKEVKTNRQLKTMAYVLLISIIDLFAEGSYIILGVVGVILIYISIQKQKREFVNSNPITNNEIR